MKNKLVSNAGKVYQEEVIVKAKQEIEESSRETDEVKVSVQPGATKATAIRHLTVQSLVSQYRKGIANGKEENDELNMTQRLTLSPINESDEGCEPRWIATS
jgi:hypothetical protein